MNPLDELTRLTTLFAEEGALIAVAEHVPASQTPEPYRQMLVHEHHMTVTMERYHGCPVNVNVLSQHRDGSVYARMITLTRSDDDRPVQFGIVRFNLDYVTRDVQNEIVAGNTPLGRILINHNVLRHIDLGAIVRITPGSLLADLLRMTPQDATFGRLATIFCNGSPAVDLLEVSAPLETPAP